MNHNSAAIQSQGGKRFAKAIVLGASIAGLSTARALSDHFEEVLVLERDQLPEGADFRPGVPQARQYHILLQSGLKQMREWFPGLEQELIAAGAVSFDPTGDVRMRALNQWYPQFPLGSTLLSCSRLLLESTIRRRLRQNPCIRFMEGVEVVGLQSDEERRRVTGVRIRNRRSGSTHQDTKPVFAADFVVDALGRRSPSPEWLAELGYPAPQESEVDSFLGYVARRYRRKPGARMIVIFAAPPHNPYGGVIFPEENNSMVAAIWGYNKHYPPTDPQELDAFIQILGPEFQKALRGAEPISEVYGYRGTSNCWHHYEKLARWPERYVVLGDAFCAFNPVYGQGMSAAAMAAAALAERVRHGSGSLDGVAQSTLKEISRITESIWLLATNADLAWPDTQGGTVRNSPMHRFGRWYVDRVLEATVDKQVRLELVAVNQLIKPASALFAPGIFLRVLKHTFRKKPGKQRKHHEPCSDRPLR